MKINTVYIAIEEKDISSSDNKTKYFSLFSKSRMTITYYQVIQNTVL